MELQREGWSYREVDGATERGVELQRGQWSYKERGGISLPPEINSIV